MCGRIVDLALAELEFPLRELATSFTDLKVTGWGWFTHSSGLDDFSRHVIARKPCTSMAAGDVAVALDLALMALGCAQTRVGLRPLHPPLLPQSVGRRKGGWGRGSLAHLHSPSG